MTPSDTRRYAEAKIEEHLSGYDGSDCDSSDCDSSEAGGWHFAFSSTRRHLGDCSYERRRIRVSRSHIAKDPEDLVRDTVLHEIAHALAEEKMRSGDPRLLRRNRGRPHGPLWKRMARRVGARPERAAKVERADTDFAWFRVCPNCKKRIGYYRKPRKTKIRKACVRCCQTHAGGRFDERFEFDIRPAREVLRGE